MSKYKVTGQLGSGERFQHLESSLQGKGIKDPAALAASIGRKKYGASKFTSLSHAHRRAHKSLGGK